MIAYDRLHAWINNEVPRRLLRPIFDRCELGATGAARGQCMTDTAAELQTLAVHAFDPTLLAPHVGGRPRVAHWLERTHAHRVANSKRHETSQVASSSAILRSISSRLRMPFSTRSCSVPLTQRS